MNMLSIRRKKLLITFGLLLLAAAVVWAASELAGQVNSLAQDAGSNSAKLEMVSLQTIKKPQKTKFSPGPLPCDWQKEQMIRQAMEANDAQYQTLVDKAKSEMKAMGQVSSATARSLRDSANAFMGQCEIYAQMWTACNCLTRARLTRETGNTRLKSAELVANGMDFNKLADLNDYQEQMRIARREYVQTAVEGDEISDQDREALKTTVLPQAYQVIKLMQDFVRRSEELLKKIQSSSMSAGSNGGGGGGGGGHGGGGGGGGIGGGSGVREKEKLIQQTTGLLGIGDTMEINSRELQVDILALIGGGLPPQAAEAARGLKTGSQCFIGAAENN